MLNPRFVVSVLALAAIGVFSSGIAAQDAPKTETSAPAVAASAPDGGVPRFPLPETPAQRLERIGTQVDPGPDPDPETVWVRFGRKYKIEKFEKRWSRPTESPRFVKPFAFANFTEEVYQENDKYVWVWIEDLPPVTPPTEEELEEQKYRELDEKQVQFLESIRGEFVPLDAPASPVRLKFENSSAGLPTSGSWRNSLAVADMNGDGNPDIVLPPERAGRIYPVIFLGDGKGGWKHQPTKWPARLNYGSVVAADFDKDGNMDLAFGIHLSGVAILLSDGKGSFREVERQTDFPTRRVVASDVDADGWMDVVAISEGPVMRGQTLRGPGYGNLRAYMNRAKGEKWEGMNIAQPGERVSGDWLASGTFNGDKYPDFAGSNVYFNGVETLYLSKGKNEYEVVPGGTDVVPFRSYYYGTTAGRFSSRTLDDAIVTFSRRWVPNVSPKLVPRPPLERVIGIDRISFAGGKPTRTPIVRWGGTEAQMVSGINQGDFDGDGKLDIVYARADTRRIVILLGDGKGGFREAAVDGLVLEPQRHYDLVVADVNKDKRPDVIMMYEAGSTGSFSSKNGKVDVFLNRGVASSK